MGTSGCVAKAVFGSLFNTTMYTGRKKRKEHGRENRATGLNYLPEQETPSKRSSEEQQHCGVDVKENFVAVIGSIQSYTKGVIWWRCRRAANLSEWSGFKMKCRCSVWALGASFPLVRNKSIPSGIALIPEQIKDDTWQPLPPTVNNN